MFYQVYGGCILNWVNGNVLVKVIPGFIIFDGNISLLKYQVTIRSTM